jgi:hypothetical protein
MRVEPSVSTMGVMDDPEKRSYRTVVLGFEMVGASRGSYRNGDVSTGEGVQPSLVREPPSCT